MSERMRFILTGDDRLTPVLNRAGDSSARLHRRLNDDMNANSRAVTAFTRDANGRLRDLRGRFLNAADAARAMAGGMPEVSRGLGGVSAAGSDAASALGRSGGGLSGVLLGVAAAAGLSLLPALGALVPMMAGGALAAGTLKLGFAGVGDAMEAAGKGKEEYEKALKKLSPEARSFTKELVGMKKEFSSVGRDVQKAMLPGFTKALKAADPLVKIVGRGMTELGGAFGKAAEGAGRLFKDSGFQKDLQTNLALGRQFVGDMLSGLGGLGRSFLSFGAASKPTLTALSGGIRDVLGRGLPGMFDGLKVGIEGSSKFLTGFFSMINNVLPAIGRFSGEVARALGPLLGEMFTSLGVRGAGALDGLGQVVKGLTPVFKDLGFGLKTTTDLIRIIGPTVKDAAGAIVGSLLPSFSQVDQAKGPLQRLSQTVRDNKGAILEGARVFANVMIEMVRGAVNAAPPIIRAWKLVSLGVLEAIGVAVGAASKLWGWVPGIGDKLRAANDSFNKFKDGYISTLNTAEKKATDFAASTNAKLSRNQLKMNINNWNEQIETAKAKLKTVPPSKRAALQAKIDDLKAKVAAAHRELNGLDGKTATTYINTIHNKAYRDHRQAERDFTNKSARGGLVPRYADGGGVQMAPNGFISGPGSGTSDSILALFASGATGRISNTEYVVNAASTRKYLPLLEAINKDRLRVRKFAKGGAAGGRGKESSGSRGSKQGQALAKDLARGFLEGLTGARDQIKAVAADLARDIKTAFSGKKETTLLKMVDRQTKQLLGLAAKRDKVAERIKEAKDYAGQVTGSARSGAQLGSLGLSVVTGGTIKTAMSGKLARIKKFTSYIKTLASRGLHKTLLRQILDMGPEEGYAYAAALVEADKATLSSISKVQHGLDDATRSLGRIGADRLYDSGKNAGKGFLAGLESQQKAIEKLMLRIAKGMQKALRAALGISSPAKKLVPDGINTARGIGVGLLKGLPFIDRAMNTVAGRMTGRTPGLATTAGRPAVVSSGGTRPIEFHIHVDGTVLDPMAVGRQIQEALLTFKRNQGGGALGLE
ncbi:hypothetical protein [Streptomyces capitiformicae]|uniref:Uncharacterized protein n=1 Tax=Streptomyces capitiformicae TaxID=2014920 RepID=A0A919L8X9_9ACTN|nr:hypothetical protein [Streptomyces capitiformicae]GHH87804.1 hypothetical protein GCM10017771_30420 [Streptomyces capitiformicae]